MVAGCATALEARAARHADKPDRERLGGHDAIMAVTRWRPAAEIEGPNDEAEELMRNIRPFRDDIVVL